MSQCARFLLMTSLRRLLRLSPMSGCKAFAGEEKLPLAAARKASNVCVGTGITPDAHPRCRLQVLCPANEKSMWQLRAGAACAQLALAVLRHGTQQNVAWAAAARLPESQRKQAHSRAGNSWCLQLSRCCFYHSMGNKEATLARQSSYDGSQSCYRTYRAHRVKALIRAAHQPRREA